MGHNPFDDPPFHWLKNVGLSYDSVVERLTRLTLLYIFLFKLQTPLSCWLIMTFPSLIFLSRVTLQFSIRSSSMLINLSAGIPVMVPSLVLVCWSCSLSGNVVSSACLLPLFADSIAGASGSAFEITSSIGVGCSWCWRFHVLVCLLCWCQCGWGCLTWAATFSLMWFLFILACSRKGHVTCSLVRFLPSSADRDSCLNVAVASPKNDWRTC